MNNEYNEEKNEKPDINLKIKKITLVEEKKQKYKADYNPFKKSPIKLKSNNIEEKQNTEFQISENKESGIESRVKSIVENTNLNDIKQDIKAQGSLMALLNIGIRGGGILFASDFKVSNAYGSFLLDQSRI